jgi:superfamily II RNA helicase
MPLLYTSKAFNWTEWSAEEIVALLAVFVADGKEDEEGCAPTTVPTRCVAAIMHVRGEMVANAMDVEKKHRVLSPDTYWNVSSQWVDPVWQLLNGAAIATVCADYGLFEGNCMKFLSKMTGLVEEWRVMATLSNDTAMLEKMAGVEERLKVGISGSESLYLRLV